MLVADSLRAGFPSFTAAEQRIARVLLENYPAAGLEPAHRLARRAATSPPTVTRFAVHLGYSGYPGLQDALRAEVAQRASSPLTQYQANAATKDVVPAAEALRAAVTSTLDQIDPQDVRRASQVILGARARLVIGGRYSSHIAHYLAVHLLLLLPQVRHVPLETMGRTSALLDVSRRTVVIAYDVRRYQSDTVEFCKRAKAQGAQVILFCDPWLSPAAEHADVVFSCSVASVSPFDSISAVLAVTEVLIAVLVDELGNQPLDRLRSFESLQPPWG